MASRFPESEPSLHSNPFGRAELHIKSTFNSLIKKLEERRDQLLVELHEMSANYLSKEETRKKQIKDLDQLIRGIQEATIEQNLIVDIQKQQIEKIKNEKEKFQRPTSTPLPHFDRSLLEDLLQKIEKFGSLRISPICMKLQPIWSIGKDPIHEAYGDTKVSGEDLDTYFRTLESEEENDISKLVTQFRRLAHQVNQTECSIARSQQNKAKNRYVNILPYNTKRVKLTPIPGVENSDYINACCIDGYWLKHAFIATQGPLQSTINDFWKMIWEQQVDTIVMLTSEVEAGRERCAHYWPQEAPEYYGQIMVELLDTRNNEHNDFIIHNIKVSHAEENRSRKVCHFQYTGWHEREIPDSAVGLINMIDDIDIWHHKANPTHPIVVHCSAGVGRTGVFIAIYNMLEGVRHENTVDVFSTVRKMRYERPAMVQTATQYRFCYLALVEFLSNTSSVYQNVKI